MNGPIGKQMVDTLVESQANVEVGKGSCLHRLMYTLIDDTQPDDT